MKTHHDNKTLAGTTIVVTRRMEQSAEFTRLLENAGARVIQCPAVAVIDPPSWNACDRAINAIGDFAAIILTSRNAASYFFNRVKTFTQIESVSNSRIYAVGEKTKQTIEAFGLRTEELPERFSAEELARMITRSPVQGKKFLFPKGNLARNEIVDILNRHGAEVEDVVVYQIVAPAMDDERKKMLSAVESEADMLTFFSPSSVHHMLAVLPPPAVSTKKIAVFGETTAAAARAAGLQIDVTAPHSSVDAFVRAIISYFSTHTESNHAITQ